jgi:hypothetical protein
MTEASFTSQEEPEFLETALLFPPADSDATDADSTTSFKRMNTTKKKDTHIPRPPNAFILFRSSFIKQQVSSPVTFSVLSIDSSSFCTICYIGSRLVTFGF